MVGEVNSKTPQHSWGRRISNFKSIISTAAWKFPYIELSLLSLIMPVLENATWFL
jgi:hypothetical protein